MQIDTLSRVTRHRCQIAEVELLGGTTRKVIVRPEEPIRFDFHAGQYLQIGLPGDRWCPFSIANPPHRNDHLELHIRPSPNSEDSLALERLLDSRGSLMVELPLGDCLLRTPAQRPTLFIAASTGFAQMKALIEYCFHWDCRMPLYLYWGASRVEDVYFDALPRQWQQAYPDFHYQSLVYGPDPDWQGRRGLLFQAITEDFDRLDEMDVYLSGSPAMVYSTLDALLPLGLRLERSHADVFSYAPRERQ